ncbi:MAG: hypothetical protein RBT15_08925 [Gudongella sp.]|jgi:hypothetical protein|nr:hypothetical protein [Gudongella sp.]
MLICDLNGLPGSGKTTLTNNVVKVLKNENIVVATREDLFNDLYSDNKFLKNIIALLNINQLRVNILIIKIAIKNKLTLDSMKWTRGLILLLYLIYKAKINSCYHILILDEGIVQYLTSIAHDKNMYRSNNYDLIFNWLNSTFSEDIIVNCNLGFTENIRRLVERRCGSKRFDFNTIWNIEEILEIKDKNLKFCRAGLSKIHTIELDMNKPLNYNTINLANFLRTITNK